MNVPLHLEEILKIKVGRELPVLNRIGTFVLFPGVVLFVLCGIVLFAGTYLPLEMKLIYFVEVVNQNVYLAFVTSIFLFIVGGKIMAFKKFYPTDLKVVDNNLIFYYGPERIQLSDKKIHKLLKTRSLFTSDKKLILKTIGLKKYEMLMSEQHYKRLIQRYPDRIQTKSLAWL